MDTQSFRILTGTEIRAAVDMPTCIQAMRAAFSQLSAGRANVPQRMILDAPPAEGMMLLMPAHLQNGPHLSVKLVSFFRGNPEKGLPLIQAMVMLYDAQNGRLLAMMDGESITALRTGAASGLATDLLAAPDASCVAIFGYGVQAETQLAAVCAVRHIRTALVFGRNRERAAAFARRMADKLGIQISAATDASSLRKAQVICTATTAAQPVFDDAHIMPGMHINGVGSFKTDMQEVPTATVQRARLIVDHRSACLKEAGDIVIPITQGVISAAHIHAELGEILNNRATGRVSDQDITFFKSVGNAIQDLALATAIWETAEQQGLGREISL